MDPHALLYIHGSESSSQTYKAQVLRKFFPEMIVPDFRGPLNLRMAQLENILGDRQGWTLVGSSLGGLMAALFAARHPGRVRKLVLLAPALHLPEFANYLPKPVRVPSLLILGRKDEVIPLRVVEKLARRVFPRLEVNLVDDDHRLHYTADRLDWRTLLEG